MDVTVKVFVSSKKQFLTFHHLTPLVQLIFIASMVDTDYQLALYFGCSICDKVLICSEITAWYDFPCWDMIYEHSSMRIVYLTVMESTKIWY